MALQFDHVTLQQGTFTLTADFTLSAATTAIIGPSGGGKSTLLAAVAGFLEPAAGAIRWRGQSLTGLAPGARPVSMLFQDNNLFPHLTAAQNVGLGLRPNLKLTADDHARISDAMAKVDLTGLEHRKPGALSGGQQSRVALARVLVADRPLVLLDEPFAALGPGLRAEMLGLLQAVLTQADKKIVIVTHDPQDARQVADEVVLVAKSTAQAPISTRDLFANPPKALRDYLGHN